MRKKILSESGNNNQSAIGSALDLLRKVVDKREELLVWAFFRGGPQGMAKVLRVSDDVSDDRFAEIFDYLVFKRGLVSKCVDRYRGFFVAMIKKGNAGALRETLGLVDIKYDKVWKVVLESLMIGMCSHYYNGRLLDQGMTAFNLLMNGLREHRSLRSYSKVWEYSVK